MSLPLWRPWARVYLGWARSNADPLLGLEEMEAGLADVCAMNALRTLPFLLGLTAEARSRAGLHQQAPITITEALDAVDDNKDLAWSADLHRLSAGIRLRSDPADVVAAETDLRNALGIAEHRGARSIQLRASRDLADLLACHGQPDKAFDLLEPCYSWFTEGQRTPDLIEARAVLDRLQRPA
jgi:hypothetical protein